MIVGKKIESDESHGWGFLASENFVGFTGQFSDGRLTKLSLIKYNNYHSSSCNYVDSYLFRKEL